MKKADRAICTLLLRWSHYYGLKAARVKSAKGPAHLHTRRLERIARHMRAAYDGIIGGRVEAES